MASGIHIVSKRLSSGRMTHYVYAWRGGPQIFRAEGERKPKLTASVHDAAAQARRSRPKTDAVLFRHLQDEWMSSGQYARLSSRSRSTHAMWAPRLIEKFGDVPIAAFDDPRMTDEITEWREQWADKPRTADQAVEVVRRTLSYGVYKRQLKTNAAFGISALYEIDRSFLTWDAEDIAAFRKVANPSLQNVLDLERCTGMRRTDLAEVTWAAVDDYTITWATAKSRRKRVVIIPLLEETRSLLDSIRNRHAEEMSQRPTSKRLPLPDTILSGARWKPWLPTSLGTAFSTATKSAGVKRHLHDLRGNFVTRLAMAGLPSDQIADIVGWSITDVREMLRRYVNKAQLAKTQAELLSRVIAD